MEGRGRKEGNKEKQKNKTEDGKKRKKAEDGKEVTKTFYSTQFSFFEDCGIYMKKKNLKRNKWEWKEERMKERRDGWVLKMNEVCSIVSEMISTKLLMSIGWL